jgi:hypothetical protein
MTPEFFDMVMREWDDSREPAVAEGGDDGE